MANRGRHREIGRREALRRLAAGAGASAALPAVGRAAAANAHPAHAPAPQSPSLGAAQPPDPALSAPDWNPKFFDEHENQTVIALADLIIPETDTPGAKTAQVNRFIDLRLTAETAENQKKYLEALGWLDGWCLKNHSKPFTDLDPTTQAEALTLLTHMTMDPQLARGAELFQTVKGSIVEAYYSSEIGSIQELKYQTNPFQAEFPGCKNPDEH